MITIYRPEDFEGMHNAGQLAARCLDLFVDEVRPGVTTETLDTLAREFILDHGALPACLGYKGYPKTLCTSINHVICHGIPNAKPLKEGDIVNIDVTVILDGWHGDTSRMYVAGKPKILAKRLMETTYKSLMQAIEIVKPGTKFGKIAEVISEIGRAEGFSIVTDFCGHGLGRVFHAPPNVMHGLDPEGNEPFKNVEMQAGMFFTIEPMINAGRKDGLIKKDGWTAITKDRSLSAQFEHSLGVTETGVEIFTSSPGEFHQPFLRNF